MARKVSIYTISDAGRDQGKTFQITEMPSAQAEAWALRALLAMVKEGVELPDGYETAGFAALATLGISFVGKLPFETAQVLMEEMFGCIRILPNPNDQSVVRNLIADDIEEVATRVKLRLAVWKLHVDFSKAASPSTSAQA